MKQNNSCYPSFLKLITRDPDEAFKEFYRFTYHSLSTTIPRPMRSLDEHERNSLISDVIYHCVKDDFRVLKSYRDKGQSFAGWLYVIAHNKTIDYLRKLEREPSANSVEPDIVENIRIEGISACQKSQPFEQFEHIDLLDKVRKCLETIGQKCRLLLELAADELTPREITAMLSLKSDQNKQVADDIRHCRSKLRKMLATEGMDLKEYLPK